MLDELFMLTGVINIGDWIPWLAVSRKFYRFLENIIDEHNARRAGVEGYVAKDIVDVLLHVAGDPEFDVKISRSGVKAFTQDLIAGGTESSAVSVEWALSEMLKQPELFFNKAWEELDRVVGRDRLVVESDIPSLTFLQCIVKEILRMHPVSPMLVPRICREGCTLDGFDVPKGTCVLVNTWTIHRNPDIWEGPDEFRPERFLHLNVDVRGQFFELLPFGSGRRMCPGYSLGLKVIELSLANLLHGFVWKLPGSMKPHDLDMDEIFGLSIPRKVPLVTVAEPRLPAHVYTQK